jgi:hypothetical protein
MRLRLAMLPLVPLRAACGGPGIVWPVFTHDATGSDVQTLLHEADRDRLLAPPPDHSPPSPIADIGECAVVRDPVAVHRLTTSGQGYFRQSGTSCELAAAVLPPGDSCDPRGAS